MIARYSKDVATLIGIAGSTLRKYCQTLEVSGHEFQKDAQNRRMFFDADIILLKRLAEASADGQRLEDAAADLVNQSQDVAAAAAQDLPAQMQPQTPQIDAQLLEKIDQMDLSLRMLADVVQRQQEVIQQQQTELIAALDQQRLALTEVAAAAQQAQNSDGWLRRIFPFSSAIRRPRR